MPKIKFTAVLIKNLKPGAKSVEYFETGREKGAGALGMRVSPKGKRTWFLAYSVGGHKTKKTTLGVFPEMTLKGARDEAINVMADINDGNDPQQEKADYRVAETFADLWKDYIQSPKFLKKAASNQREEKRKYEKHLKKTIGPMKVQDIRIKHLSPVLHDIAKSAPVVANRLFALLSFIFKFALNRGVVEIHPMYGMDKPGGREFARKRYLSPEEIKKLWPDFDDLTPAIACIFKLILLTAQRPGEVMAMEREEIDLDEKIWTIPADKTKTKAEHVVPLNAQALAIIEPLLDGSDRFLFPAKRGKSGHITNLSKARYSMWEDTDVKDWTAHDLRRTARTLLSKVGIKSDIAERVLNHSRGKIEQVYDHYGFLDEKRIALDKLGREIARITGKKPGGKVVQLRRAVQ